jgi:hypothetical protein
MGYRSPNLVTVIVTSTNLATPLDSTIYYVGMQADAPTTTGGNRVVRLPVSGQIVGATIMINSTTATGTAEDIVMDIRINNTTDYTIATVGVASAIRVFQDLQMSVPIKASDFFEIKITMPAWATNPEGMKIYGHIVIATE